MTILYILLAIFIFGFLIFIHELGHYICARIFHVSISEFSIGMGPKLISRPSKKTGIIYSWRLFPIGGFVAMEGEDGDSSSPDAFCKKPGWQRLIILSAGAVSNLLFGFLVMFILVASNSGTLVSNTIAYYPEAAEGEISSSASGLAAGDTVVKIGNTHIHIGNELVYEIMHQGDEPVDVTVIRNGETITFSDVVFPTEVSSGVLYGVTDFKVSLEDGTFGNIIKHSFFRSVSTVKMIWESLIDLISGKYGVEAVSGPVGVTEVMVETAKSGLSNLVYLTVVIAVNLGIFNLLPFPALDGGRFFLTLLEMIRKKPLNPKIEGYINFVGFALLIILMVAVSLKDIITLFIK